MTDRHLTTLPNPEESAALEAALMPLFEQSAARPSAEVLERLAGQLTQSPRTRWTPWQGLALAAIAFVALALGQWTIPTDDRRARGVEDLSWSEVDDGLDLMLLPSESHDPELALEVVDALIAELDDA